MDISSLEKKYQLTARSASISERFGMHEEYQSYLEKQIDVDPNNIRALIHLGVLSWEPFHEDEKAIEYLTKAIALDPENVEARFWLATCYYHDFCAYEKSRGLLLEALKIDPNRPECLSLLASILMDTTKNINEAIECYEKAIGLVQDWPVLYRSIAELYLEINDIEKAEFYVQQGLQCKSLLIQPKNNIEDYFEKIVAGRSWTNHRERFQKLTSVIQKLRAYKKNQPHAH